MNRTVHYASSSGNFETGINTKLFRYNCPKAFSLTR